MLQTTKFSAIVLFTLVSIGMLFSFSQASLPQNGLNLLEEGDPPVSVTLRTRKTNGVALEATVVVTKGSNSTSFQTTNGEATIPSFGTGIHQIKICKAGYVTINSSFDAQGETMTLEYTLVED